MNPAEAICLFIEQTAASVYSLFQPVAPPVRIDLLGLSRMEHADTDRGGGIEQSDGQEAVLAIIDDRQLTSERWPVLFEYAICKEPGMTRTQL